ncbi:hypothetical protein LSCM1_02166 [Leishmania martiniquensis]|uniref:Uncharacterized protein n=1 Tax=Leishmania martiniquensis TaxID=1580590 RepID=A0A836H0L3_9TRYP|nr:hypothetical protein LSCM1_02166 [Leishmania martiniquensis]
MSQSECRFALGTLQRSLSRVLGLLLIFTESDLLAPLPPPFLFGCVAVSDRAFHVSSNVKGAGWQATYTWYEAGFLERRYALKAGTQHMRGRGAGSYILRSHQPRSCRSGYEWVAGREGEGRAPFLSFPPHEPPFPLLSALPLFPSHRRGKRRGEGVTLTLYPFPQSETHTSRLPPSSPPCGLRHSFLLFPSPFRGRTISAGTRVAPFAYFSVLLRPGRHPHRMTHLPSSVSLPLRDGARYSETDTVASNAARFRHVGVCSDGVPQRTVERFSSAALPLFGSRMSVLPVLSCSCGFQVGT